MEKPKKEIRKIAVMGASSVYGVGDEEYGGFAGRLKSWRFTKGNRNFVYNLGIPGNTSQNILNRMDIELSSRKPDLIIFSFGNNDSSRQGKPDENPPITFLDEYRKNIESILTKAREYSDKVMVLGVYPFDEAKTMPYNNGEWHFLLYDAINYDYAVAEICEELNVEYCNIMSSWLKRGYKDLLSPDGLHANVKGYEFVFDTLKQFLISNFDLEE